MPAVATLPRLGNIDDIARICACAKSDAYKIARRFPPGLAIKLGGRLRFDLDRLAEWLRAGGDAA